MDTEKETSVLSLYGDLKSTLFEKQGGRGELRRDSAPKLNLRGGIPSSGIAALKIQPSSAQSSRTACSVSEGKTNQSPAYQGHQEAKCGNSIESIRVPPHPQTPLIDETDSKPFSDLGVLNVQPSSTQQSVEIQGHRESQKIVPRAMPTSHEAGHSQGHVEATKIPPAGFTMAPAAVKHEQWGAGQPVGHDSVDALPVKVEPSMATGAGYAGAASQFQQVGRQIPEGQISQREYIEQEKDLIFFELAELITGKCKLRYLALRLRVTESQIVQMEGLYPNDITTQMYQILQLFWKRSREDEVFPSLHRVLEALNLYSAAEWLDKRIDPNADDAVPMETETANEEPQQNAGPREEFFDIFLMHSGSSQDTRKIQEICGRRSWKVKTYEENTIAGVPVLQAIEDILSKSTHLIILITTEDCARYRRHEMSTSVEMAYQQAQLTGELMGRVIPIRCCEKRALPLSLMALTGVHITDANLEDRLKITIDTGLRRSREAGSQAR